MKIFPVATRNCVWDSRKSKDMKFNQLFWGFFQLKILEKTKSVYAKKCKNKNMVQRVKPINV